MPTKRTPEKLRKAIHELLEQGLSQRQIQARIMESHRTRVGFGVISSVKRESGQTVHRSPPRTPPAPSSQEMDGMSEFQPPPRGAPLQPEHPPTGGNTPAPLEAEHLNRSAPDEAERSASIATGEHTMPKTKRSTTGAPKRSTAPTGRKPREAEHPAPDEAEHPPREAERSASSGARSELDTCTNCGGQWRRDAGEEPPTKCPFDDCGVEFA